MLRKLSWVVAIVLGLITMPGLANPMGSCRFEGSFIGFEEGGNAYWISNSQGHSASEGTVILETLIDPATLSFLIPGAVDHTEFRGVWRRIDGNTIRLVMVALAFNEIRQTVGIAKLVNTDQLDEDCTKVLILESTLEVYAPDANPFSDPYLFAMPMNPHEGYRVVFP